MNRAEMTVRDAWRRLGGVAKLGEGESDGTIDAVVARYSEPHRHYHTIDHVAAVLDHVERLLQRPDAGAATVDADVVRAGALFHDVVYDPRSATNEADSAAIAVEAIRPLRWSADRLGMVEAIVMATATHAGDSPEAAVLLDADLAVLGASPSDYRRYVEAVRAEFAFVDDAGWTSGRSAVLRSLIEREHIFATSSMLATREAQARQNLADELHGLLLGVHQRDDIGE